MQVGGGRVDNVTYSGALRLNPALASTAPTRNTTQAPTPRGVMLDAESGSANARSSDDDGLTPTAR